MVVQDLAGATFCAGKAGVTMGTTTTVTIGSAVGFCINGKAYATTAASNAAVTSFYDPNTGAAPKALSAGYGCIFVACAVSTGTVATLRFVQSEIVPLIPITSATDYTTSAFVDPPEFPAIPDGMCPIGYFVVKAGTNYTSGGTFVFGTTSVATGAQNSAATAYSVSAQDVMVLPNRPQLS